MGSIPQPPPHLLLNYHDAVIYPSDLALLDSPTAWVNDAIIHFQFTRLQQHQQQSLPPPSSSSSSSLPRMNCSARQDDGHHHIAVMTMESKKKADVASYDDDDDEHNDETKHMITFLDPAVISFVMHQLLLVRDTTTNTNEENDDDDDDDDDNEYYREISNLYTLWKLPTIQNNSVQEETTTQPSSIITSTSSSEKVAVQQHQQTFIVPICDQFGESMDRFVQIGGGNHWSILVWDVIVTSSTMSSSSSSSSSSAVDSNHPNQNQTRHTNFFYHFDSMNGYNAYAARMVAKKLDAIVRIVQQQQQRQRQRQQQHHVVDDDIVFVECQAPQQTNGYDCGLFALAFAEAMTSCFPPPTSSAVKKGNANRGYDLLLLQPPPSLTSIVDEKRVAEVSRIQKELYERTVRAYFEEKSCDIEDYVSSLRRRISDDIRILAGIV